jgi:hypothetical protein
MGGAIMKQSNGRHVYKPNVKMPITILMQIALEFRGEIGKVQSHH